MACIHQFVEGLADGTPSRFQGQSVAEGATVAFRQKASNELEWSYAVKGNVMHYARYFARHLPPVLTDRERLANDLLRLARAKKPERTREDDRVRDRTLEMTR